MSREFWREVSDEELERLAVEDQRVIVRLRAGLSQREAAASIGISRAAFRRRLVVVELHYARLKSQEAA